jgi:nitroreductase
MDVYEAAVSRRTVRRFKQDKIPTKALKKVLNAARLAPSGANLQPCEYVVVTDPIEVNRMFSCLKWAAFIAPYGDPPDGERPTAYIVVLLNRTVRETGGTHDAAAAIENILLVAYEEGIGSCWLGSVDREKVKMILSIPANCEIDSVVALGYPNERPVLEEARGSTNYWKDGKGILHVPKRQLEDITHLNGYGGHA